MAKIEGYKLASILRNTRGVYPLTATEQALYYELAAIYNTKGTKYFYASSHELCGALLISPNTLKRAIDSLVAAGLILYSSGSSKRSVSAFSLATPSGTVAKSEADAEADFIKKGLTPAVSPSNFEADTDKKVSSIINSKLKGKLKDIPGVPPGESKPVKKSAPKKAEVQINKTEHWQKMVDLWFTFYKERFLNDPTFNGIAAKNLKLVLKRLQKITEDGGKIWDEAMAIKVFNRFLTLAFADKWLQDNFILNNLYSKFDSIINKANGSHQQSTQQTGSGKSAGANQLLNELSAELSGGTGFGIQSDD